MALDSRVKTIVHVIKIGIEIYIKTYGETDSPSGKSVDMPRLEKVLNELIGKNLVTVLEEVAAYKRSVSRHFPRSDLLLLNTTLDNPSRYPSYSKQKKLRFQSLLLSHGIMESIVVAQTLSAAAMCEDKVVAHSCVALTGLLIALVGDVNHGEIPKHFIDTLIACGVEMELVDSADIEMLSIDGHMFDALSQQCDRRQAALFGV
jgi:hypothetical protein